MEQEFLFLVVLELHCFYLLKKSSKLLVLVLKVFHIVNTVQDRKCSALNYSEHLRRCCLKPRKPLVLVDAFCVLQVHELKNIEKLTQYGFV
jgi:hypothetical protein